ncbi:MAG TPA: Ig-like domain-containing protein [Polyangiaceae bacterium]|nr:Ig-like domain-containing protein [Polyangiaceae bacterium]
MPELELPALVVDDVVAVAAPGRLALVNRDPGPDEEGVPLPATIALELVDTGESGVDVAETRVWVGGVPAFAGRRVVPPFDGPRAGVVVERGDVRLVLDPRTPFSSLERVEVRVASRTLDGRAALEERYAFVADDRTAPRVLAATTRGPKCVVVAFDESVDLGPSFAATFEALDVPAVPVAATQARAEGSVLTLDLEPELSPGARYDVRLTGVVDRSGNVVLPPFDRATFVAPRPPRPARRRFDLWSMLPKHNRRADDTGDLARFVACLQEITDLALADIDRFADLLDLERAPEPFVDAMLEDLGNPFRFELSELEKRRLASVLVAMYREKGTEPGLKNAVRFLLGVEVTRVLAFAGTALTLGESELGVDWELGPSGRFARYAFHVEVSRPLSPPERKHVRALIDLLKPGHTHFLGIIEPTLLHGVEHWVLGISDLGDTTLL